MQAPWGLKRAQDVERAMALGFGVAKTSATRYRDSDVPPSEEARQALRVWWDEDLAAIRHSHLCEEAERLDSLVDAAGPDIVRVLIDLGCPAQRDRSNRRLLESRREETWEQFIEGMLSARRLALDGLKGSSASRLSDSELGWLSVLVRAYLVKISALVNCPALQPSQPKNLRALVSALEQEAERFRVAPSPGAGQGHST